MSLVHSRYASWDAARAATVGSRTQRIIDRTLDFPADTLMLSVTAFADELERERARQRTRGAMERKARAGHVTGGRLFGYDNRDVLAEAPDPDGKRKPLHVERVVNPEEAAVVRRIFEMCTHLPSSQVNRTRRLIALSGPAPEPPI